MYKKMGNGSYIICLINKFDDKFSFEQLYHTCK